MNRDFKKLIFSLQHGMNWSDDKKFLHYIKSYYDSGGLYPLKSKDGKFPTKKIWEKAIEIYKETSEIPFDGDTRDREGVRRVLYQEFDFMEDSERKLLYNINLKSKEKNARKKNSTIS